MGRLSQIDLRVLDYLVGSGDMSAAQKSSVIAKMQSKGLSLDHAIMSLGIVEEKPLLESIANIIEVNFVVDPTGLSLDQTAFQKLGAGFWSDKSALPVQTKAGAEAILVSRPFDAEAWAEIEFFIREPRKKVIAPSALIRSLHQRMFDVEVPSPTAALRIEPKISKSDGEAAAAIDDIFSHCIELGASDIHIDRTADSVSVRARVHGRLQPIHVPPEADANAIFSSLKLMGGMNIVERRLPQDGSCQFNHSGKLVELRLSTLPTPNGETFVCRILARNFSPDDLSDLGFSPDTEAKIKLALERPFGLIVIAGPTGSGKTTTLYTALRQLADGTRKVISAEDPIEQRISGVTQVQVDIALGLNFGDILRTSLRHDPDVIMIGEVRDEETAEIACRAALVGRLVLATVHASSAHLVRERFINLGVPAYLIDEVLIAAVSQRLERQLCSNCRGKSCDECGHSGAVGRKLQVEIEVT